MKKVINAFFMSLSMFCALPCPIKNWDEEARPYMTLMLPLVGAWIGLLWLGAAFILQILKLPVLLSAAFLTFFHFKITGFIHADGFMDCSDALLSSRDLEGRRKILKDPCCGSFSVICIVFLILTEFAAFASSGADFKALNSGLPGQNLNTVISQGPAENPPYLLILIPVVSRALSGFYISVLKPLPTSQYSGSYRNKLNNTHIAIYIGYILAAFAVCIIIKSGSGAITIAGEVLVHSLAVYIAYKALDGMNGDISGYAISLSECVAVILMAVIR